LFKQLAQWLDDRTGLPGFIRGTHEAPIPGGARWSYVFGPALTTAFLVQAFTGLLMMLSYAPSSSTAWSSVFYIKQEMWMGWFIRGVHHFSAQALMVLLPLHLLQVVLARAYRRPREFVWWFGLALLFLAAAFSLTGYLLPWDQKGYWHARVATNIMGSAPVVGPYILKVLIGGTDYGNQTVTHFYGLHVAVLPLLFVLFTTAHIALFRRYGVTPPVGAGGRPAIEYWPEQAVRDTLFSAAVVGVVITLTLIEGGTSLDAPADPSSADYPARPEWYFLSLFQMLKLFPGEREVIGTFVIPMSVAVALLLLPFLDRLLCSRSWAVPASSRSRPSRPTPLIPCFKQHARRPTRRATAPSSWPDRPRSAFLPMGRAISSAVIP
jgi:ubiquinol-cytochrome c reductase cytochrome b subunit